MTKPELERLAIVEEKVRNIEISVTNHIPTALEKLDAKIDKINLRLAYASGAIAIIIVLAQIAVNRWGG